MLDQPLVEDEERKFAHSDKLVFPITKYPLSISCWIRKALFEGKLSLRANEPAVFANPFTSMLSLIAIGFKPLDEFSSICLYESLLI